jgi:SAM-dependent methyltransferase
MIEWCQKNFADSAPHFEFRFYDIKSAYTDLDGQAGAIAPEAFEFPFRDRSIDSAVLVSVFTHMPLIEIDAYAQNLRRILASDGRALLSVFFAEHDPEVVGLGYYHLKDQIETLFEQKGFIAKQLWATRYGPKHNWYLLR